MFTLKLLITSSLLIWLLFSVSMGKVIAAFKSADLVYILLAGVLLNARVILFGTRWQLILANFQHKATITSLTKIHFIGIFYNNFFPSSVGGDFIRGIMLKSNNISTGNIISSILIERLLGVASLLLISLLSMAYVIVFSNELLPSGMIVQLQQILIASILGGLLIILFNKTLASLCHKIRLDIKSGLTDHKISTTIHSILIHLIGVIATYFLAISVGSTISFYYFLILYPIVIIISMVPISLNGLGLREGAFIFLFSHVGMDNEVALTVTLLWLGLFYTQCIFGYYFSQKYEIASLLLAKQRH